MLSEGLLRSALPRRTHLSRGDAALAPTMARAGERPILLEVDLDRLDEVSEFVSDEGRVHGDIPPERLRVYDEPVMPSRGGWVDPAYMPDGNHPACLRRWKR